MRENFGKRITPEAVQNLKKSSTYFFIEQSSLSGLTGIFLKSDIKEGFQTSWKDTSEIVKISGTYIFKKIPDIKILF